MPEETVMTDDMFEKLKDELRKRDEALHKAASKCQRGRIADIIELIREQRIDAHYQGTITESANWYRFGAFQVSINWYPIRLWRFWRERFLRHENPYRRWWQMGPPL